VRVTRPGTCQHQQKFARASAFRMLGFVGPFNHEPTLNCETGGSSNPHGARALALARGHVGVHDELSKLFQCVLVSLEGE
jgi:hypothetical protein